MGLECTAETIAQRSREGEVLIGHRLADVEQVMSRQPFAQSVGGVERVGAGLDVDRVDERLYEQQPRWSVGAQQVPLRASVWNTIVSGLLVC